MDMKLEVVVIPVSDVDRAKRFYEKLGWRLDIDIAAGENFRAIQFTPPNSEASIIFGKGVTSARPGSIDRLVLAVSDIDAARAELRSHGVESELFHDAGGSLGGGFIADAAGRAPGPDPERRSYASYATFSDPDGNVWMLQEIKERLPGREWDWKRTRATDVAALAELLHETSEHHGAYERSHPKHDWWDWYAPYLGARQNGSSPEEAAAAAERYADEILGVVHA